MLFFYCFLFHYTKFRNSLRDFANSNIVQNTVFEILNCLLLYFNELIKIKKLFEIDLFGLSQNKAASVLSLK